MNVNEKPVNKAVSKPLIALMIIVCFSVLESFLFGDGLGALINVVVVILGLKAFFSLFDSHEELMDEMMECEVRISTLEEKLRLLEEPLHKDGGTQESAKLQTMVKPLPQRPAQAQKPIPEPDPGEILPEGFVRCPNPYCREIQMHNREACWKCGTKLDE